MQQSLALQPVSTGVDTTFPEIPKEFRPLKAPKRAKARESKSDMLNTIRRVLIDLTLATEHRLTEGWAFGCYLFDNRCYICGGEFTADNPAQADHVYPPCLGGSINAGNMLPAHGSCNSHKGESDPEVYFADKPETLELIRLFQARFDYSPDEAIYGEVIALAELIGDDISQHIIHARSARELSVPDLGEDAVEKLPQLIIPLVNNLLRAVKLHMETQGYAKTARKKVERYCRRILNSWCEQHPSEDMFTSDEDTLRRFALRFYLSLTDHPDSFNRAHRAFRVLAEVFNSASLANLYAGEPPFKLQDIRESYEWTEAGWVPLEVELMDR